MNSPSTEIEPASPRRPGAREPDPRRRSVIVHAIWAGVILCLIAAPVVIVHSLTEQARLGTERIASRALEIASKFQTGTISTTFHAEMPVFHSAGVGRLEVCISDPVPVTFVKADERRVFWDWISLGQTVSEIEVPTTFRYYVDLNEQWRIERDGHKCVVYPPPVKVSAPPAIHTDQMKKKTSNGWARFDKIESLDALERSITPELTKRAATYFPKAREESRLTIAKFIRAWLQREEQWTDGELNSIIVVFPDEVNKTQPVPTLTTNSRL